MSEEKLDAETEATIDNATRAWANPGTRKQYASALRSRIRFLIEEARKSGESEGARQVRQMVRLEMGLSDV